jgi:hypothetical protein
MSENDGRKLSYSELDRLRREGGNDGPRKPRSEKAQEREKQATSEYMRSAEKALFSKTVDADGERLAKELRAAHGTKELATTCQAYFDAKGVPKELVLLGIFLDSRDSKLICAAMKELLQGEYDYSGSSLKSQLKVLAFDSDDSVAELAEELLEAN